MMSPQYSSVQARLAYFVSCQQQSLLRGGKMGLEKESLRVNAAGTLAQTRHPYSLGSPLTHPYITTDYSEALCEFVTPPLETPSAALDFLRGTQQYVYKNLQSEVLWATSMPCVVAGETSIPVAYYGTSNAGRMKTLYRVGLGYRYGRVMQVIAGVHFNYSVNPGLWSILRAADQSPLALSEFINAGYLAMIRNLQRLGWLIPYLFGASPAICKSFLGGTATALELLDEGTYYGQYATSLRMGNIGYQNNQSKQTGFKANYDSLDAYLNSLRHAISTPYPAYEQIGVRVGREYRQLNSHILQIENEYYSTIRPKQPLIGNEKPSVALQRRGVSYVELRSLDVNAFEPLGISLEQMYFLEALLLFCLLQDSPPISPQERQEIDQNELLTAHRGREPGLQLQCQGQPLRLQQWALEISTALLPLCQAMDQGLPGNPYCNALSSQQQLIVNPDLTPSAQMLQAMREHHEGFYQLAQRLSRQHYRYFISLPPNPEMQLLLAQMAERSRHRQALLERSDRLSFPQYLKCYFAQA